MKERSPITAEQALARAEELCARAEHASGEIREKLWRWGIGPDQADGIIDSLQERRFLDDARFARAFVRDKIEFAGWGRRKIALALYKKRVPRDIITEALESIDMEAYTARLAGLIRRAAEAMGDDARTYEGRTRLYRRAAARGFEPDIIAPLLPR